MFLSLSVVVGGIGTRDGGAYVHTLVVVVLFRCSLVGFELWGREGEISAIFNAWFWGLLLLPPTVLTFLTTDEKLSLKNRNCRGSGEGKKKFQQKFRSGPFFFSAFRDAVSRLAFFLFFILVVVENGW